MKAIQVRRYGGPEALELLDVDAPDLGAGQARVQLEFSGVLWLDTILRTGQGPPQFKTDLPWTPGNGGAGVVREVGSEADSDWVGRRVLVDAPGSYAEQLVAPVTQLVPIPDGVETSQAMALLHDGGTALGLWQALSPAPEDLVLVQPAAGGAGSVLVQLAVHHRVPVIAAARGREKLRWAAELGATEVIDYGQAGWGEWLVAEAERRPTVVFDGVGGELGAAAYALTAPGGRRVNYGNSAGAPTADDGRTDVSTVGMEILSRLGERRRARQEEILQLAASGAITARVTTWPLAEAAEAHRALAARSVVGKVLLTM